MHENEIRQHGSRLKLEPDGGHLHGKSVLRGKTCSAVNLPSVTNIVLLITTLGVSPPMVFAARDNRDTSNNRATTPAIDRQEFQKLLNGLTWQPTSSSHTVRIETSAGEVKLSLPSGPRHEGLDVHPPADVADRLFTGIHGAHSLTERLRASGTFTKSGRTGSRTIVRTVNVMGEQAAAVPAWVAEAVANLPKGTVVEIRTPAAKHHVRITNTNKRIPEGEVRIRTVEQIDGRYQGLHYMGSVNRGSGAIHQFKIAPHNITIGVHAHPAREVVRTTRIAHLPARVVRKKP